MPNKIEEQKLKQVGSELKKVRIENGISSKTKFEVQDKPRFKIMFSNQGPSNAPRVNKSKVSSPKPQEGKGGKYYVQKPLFAKFDKRHDGKCLIGMGNCYGCGESGHIKRDRPMMKAQGMKNSQAQ